MLSSRSIVRNPKNAKSEMIGRPKDASSKYAIRFLNMYPVLVNDKPAYASISN